MANTDDLMSLVRSEPAGPFQPYVEISKEADALNVYFRGDADYSKRLTDHVTLFLSLDTNEIVGCRIKGIATILEDLPNFIDIDHDGVRLSMLFWSFRGSVENEAVRSAFNELAKYARDMIIQPC